MDVSVYPPWTALGGARPEPMRLSRHSELPLSSADQQKCPRTEDFVLHVAFSTRFPKLVPPATRLVSWIRIRVKLCPTSERLSTAFEDSRHGRDAARMVQWAFVRYEGPSSVRT